MQSRAVSDAFDKLSNPRLIGTSEERYLRAYICQVYAMRARAAGDQLARREWWDRYLVEMGMARALLFRECGVEAVPPLSEEARAVYAEVTAALGLPRLPEVAS
jgi:hypothetical protein